MVAAPSALKDIERRIVAVVAEADGPVVPADLIERLKGEGHPEDLVRAAIWFLIDRGRIRLTSELFLSPAARVA